MSKRPTAVPPLVAALALSACGSPSGTSDVLCTGNIEPAVLVTVRDSATGAPATAEALAVARDGAYADSARGPANVVGDFALGLAPERPGTYTVTVERAGYRPWRREGVRVTRGECHVHRVDLTALLQRAS